LRLTAGSLASFFTRSRSPEVQASHNCSSLDEDIQKQKEKEKKKFQEGGETKKF